MEQLLTLYSEVQSTDVRWLTDGQCKMRINGMGFVQSLLDANGLVTGKDYQFSGRYDIEKNAVVISLAANEKGNLISLKEFGASGTL